MHDRTIKKIIAFDSTLKLNETINENDEKETGAMIQLIGTSCYREVIYEKAQCRS